MAELILSENNKIYLVKYFVLRSAFVLRSTCTCMNQVLACVMKVMDQYPE